MQRELQVMFSLRAQPLWFRVLKWSIFLGLIHRFRRARWMWPTVGGLGGAGMLMHLLYRRNTQGWTQPWGGWNDPLFVTAAQE